MPSPEQLSDLTAERLLGLPVRSCGIRLGYPVDLIVDLDRSRVVGIQVHCGDEVTRFLPFAAARIEEDEIDVPSALMLLDEQGAMFYRSRAASLRELRNRGELADVAIAADGSLTLA